VEVAGTRFDRRFFDPARRFRRIGGGAIGGKASGLFFAEGVLASELDRNRFPGLDVDIPALVALGTDVFDAFLAENPGLADIARADLPDARIALAFQQGRLPPEVLGDLRALVQEVRTPLAVRSSSLLEDALGGPFAGVYTTKMIANLEPDADARFRRLVEAVKLVYASTFFRRAQSYRRSVGEAEEKMAVILQEIVGARHGDLFFPDVSGVARSHNFYAMGSARPEDGVVSLALGLGKTIVDGGACWTYSPERPKAPPPYGSLQELLEESQTSFWAVNMGRPPAYDPIAETEFLVRADLGAAERAGVLGPLASTYDPDSDRLDPGIDRPGPRVLNFPGPLCYGEPPLNDAIRELLDVFERAAGAKVEIELAGTLLAAGRARLGFLQVRPILVSGNAVEIPPEAMEAPDLLCGTERALGNGRIEDLGDVVYVRPDRFSASRTREIAGALEAVNARLLAEGRPYLLIGFGRWGSSDPWLGIPVAWAQIAGARALVEATLPGMDVEPSQGSHFFHNLMSFEVPYLLVSHRRAPGIDWAWLDRQPGHDEGEWVRHVRLSAPLRVRVDGRTGRGGIWHP
jgi:hypothetical protein